MTTVVSRPGVDSPYAWRLAIVSMLCVALGVGGVFMGWLADRTSPRVPLLIGGVSIALGGWVAASGSELALYVGYTVLLGFFGNAATFTPAMNNVQGWFDRGRN